MKVRKEVGLQRDKIAISKPFKKNKLQIIRNLRSEDNLRPSEVGQIGSKSSREFCPFGSHIQ